VPLPAVPAALFAAGLRRAVLGFLAENGAISEDLHSKLLSRRHS